MISRPDNRKSLRLVSLNIEGHKRLELVTQFLKTTQIDALLLQEVFKEDANLLAQTLGMSHVFGPMCRRPLDYKEGDSYEWGVAMLSKHPLRARVSRYGGDPGEVPELKIGPRGKPLVHAARTLILGRVEKNGVPYDLATTHFSWTPNGEASGQQRQDLRGLLRLLMYTPEIVLAGDFNAPRGGEIHSKLTKHFIDRMPPHIKTTIDGKFHRAGFLRLVVDYLLTSPGYEAENVYIVNGVSDHWAVMAQIHRADSVNESLNHLRNL